MPLSQPFASETKAVLDALHSSEQGISNQDARQRLDAYGPNALKQNRTIGTWTIFFDQFRGVVVLLLAVAAAISWAMAEYAEALAVLAVLAINATIGFSAEWRATRSMKALLEMVETLATVKRDGQAVSLDAQLLVPGDIVLLEAGDIVPADLRLIVVEGLHCDESILTGESATYFIMTFSASSGLRYSPSVRAMILLLPSSKSPAEMFLFPSARALEISPMVSLRAATAAPSKMTCISGSTPP